VASLAAESSALTRPCFSPMTMKAPVTAPHQSAVRAMPPPERLGYPESGVPGQPEVFGVDRHDGLGAAEPLLEKSEGLFRFRQHPFVSFPESSVRSSRAISRAASVSRLPETRRAISEILSSLPSSPAVVKVRSLATVLSTRK
jgi:hypothetical protein